MSGRTRLVATALTAIAIIGAATAEGSAGTFRASETGWLIAWKAASPLTFENRSETFRAVCTIRFKGAFEAATFNKVVGARVGQITESRVSACTTGRAWILNGVERKTPEEPVFASTLPWTLNYSSFAGTLPAIARITFRIVGFSVLIEELFESCLYRSRTETPLVIELQREVGGRITAVIPGAATIPASRGLFCPELRLTGTGEEITNGNKTAFLTVTLI